MIKMKASRRKGKKNKTAVPGKPPLTQAFFCAVRLPHALGKRSQGQQSILREQHRATAIATRSCLEPVWLTALHLWCTHTLTLSTGANPEPSPTPQDHGAAGNTCSQKGLRENKAISSPVPPHALPHVQDVTNSIKWVVTWSDHLPLEKISGN